MSSPELAQVALRVADADAERARAALHAESGLEALAEYAEAPTPTGAAAQLAPRCPICGSAHLAPESSSGILRVLSLVLSQLLPLPEPQAAGLRRLRCGICGYRWRPGDRREHKVPPIG